MKNFNVCAWFKATTAGIKTVVACILNSFIEILNQREWLPKMLVIIIDKDILADLNYVESSVHRWLVTAIKWLLANINRCINSRTQDLFSKKPGAVKPNEPKLIWLKMIPRPQTVNMNDNEYGNMMSTRHSFNLALEETIRVDVQSYMLDIRSLSVKSPQFFDNAGKLSATGKTQFCKELDHHLKLFD